MTSVLTATSRKSILLYLWLVILVAVGAIYLVTYREPSIQQNFYLQALKLNYAAFENGIRFANIRFVTAVEKQSYRDLWVDDQRDKYHALDFNQYGFPIGTEIENNLQKMPATDTHCRQIWEFVLGPLQPETFAGRDNINIPKNHTSYWTEIETNGICLYYSSQVTDRYISYNAKQGKVRLVNLSSMYGLYLPNR